MKRLLTRWFLFLLLLPVMVSAGKANTPHLFDKADNFTPSQEAEIEKALRTFSEKYNTPTYFATVDDPDVIDNQDYTDLFLEDLVGINKTGIILLVNWGNRKVSLSTSGDAMEMLAGKRENKILDGVQDSLSINNINGAYEKYINKLNDYYSSGKPKSTAMTLAALITFALGLIGPQIFYHKVKKSYKGDKERKEYRWQENSIIDVPHHVDIYTHTTTTSRRISDNDSSGGSGHTSSSGGSHGGGTRSF